MITGRCYCGAVSLTADTQAQTVTYCHCADCRRVTGAPVTAFAAVAKGNVQLESDTDAIRHVTHTQGVERWFCGDCGSPLKAWFQYLPDQDYLPLGVLDQAPDLPPEHHCYVHSAMPWMNVDDGLPRSDDSGSEILQAATDV